MRFGRPKKRLPGLYKSTGESYLAGHIAKSMTGCDIKLFVFDIEKVAVSGRAEYAAARVAEGRETAGS